MLLIFNVNILIYSRDSFDFRDQDIKIVIQKCRLIY